MLYSPKTIISIIGGGPAAMMLACELNENLFDVHIYEQKNQIGKKFLVAGNGGFNLTNGSELEPLLSAYEAPSIILESIRRFDNEALRKWLSNIGIETFVGSSGRVFPIAGIKPIQVLQVIKEKLHDKNVQIHTRHQWRQSNETTNTFITEKGEITVPTDITVLAMGGASWQKTGSDGKWLNTLQENGIKCVEFEPANCALHTHWPESVKVHEGKPLKNIALRLGDDCIKGELVITAKGIEGTPAYTFSHKVAHALKLNHEAIVTLDLKPHSNKEDLIKKVARSEMAISKQLKNKLSLSTAAIALLKSNSTKEEFLNPELLVEKIKNLPLTITSIANIDEAISVTGGIAQSEYQHNYQISNKLSTYAIGEMLDWHAPTGGYLLQACFSMGWDLAQSLNQKYG